MDNPLLVPRGSQSIGRVVHRIPSIYMLRDRMTTFLLNPRIDKYQISSIGSNPLRVKFLGLIIVPLLQIRNGEMLPNKTYKADLENKKLVFAEIGLLVALLAVYLLFNAKFSTSQSEDIDLERISALTEEIIPVTVQESKPKPPEPPQQTTVLQIVENDAEVAEEIEINVAADQETVIEEYLPPVLSEIEEEEAIEEEPIFVVVESMPVFPGGMTALMKYLHENLKYPCLAKETNIQGRVFVSFVVETDGSITDVKVLRGIGGGCDEEAIRVVSNMPNWIPGKQRGVAVRVRFNLPIRFTLQ